MSTKILIGDCREVLKTLPEKSVHCCVTSPPYFGLRSYCMTGDRIPKPFSDIQEIKSHYRHI